MISTKLINAIFENQNIKSSDNPLSDACLYDIIADAADSFTVKTWLEQIQYEGYRRLLEHQTITPERKEKTRGWLVNKMGAKSSSHLCGWEAKWLNAGKPVDPHRACDDGTADESSTPPKPARTKRPPAKKS